MSEKTLYFTNTKYLLILSITWLVVYGWDKFIDISINKFLGMDDNSWVYVLAKAIVYTLLAVFVLDFFHLRVDELSGNLHNTQTI